MKISRVLFLSMAAGSTVLPCVTQAQTVNDPNLLITPFLSGLSEPTGFQFSGPDAGFVIEKASGQVKRFDGGVLSGAPVLDLAVNSNNERGLLGIALDPGFDINGFAYLYYSASNTAADTSNSGGWAQNRVARYQWNGSTLVDTGVSRTFGTSADGQANGANHNGGPLVFGADGKLYGVTGDLNRDLTEQNTSSGGLSSGVGGVYRLNTDLSVPTDNPFVAANPNQGPFYGYGVRNSFGLAVDPATGNLWDTENGPNSYDEINLVARGFNSGWTRIMGPDSRDAQDVSDLVNLANSAYSDPEFSFLNPVAVTSLQFLYGSAWGPSYDDAVIVGDNNTGRLYLLRLNAARDGFVLDGNLADLVADNGTEQGRIVFGNGFSVVTGMQTGSDGALYVSSYGSGTIYRIAPVPEPETWAFLAFGLGVMALRLRPRARSA